MLRLRTFGILLSALLFAISCTKIDTTKIGSDLIPAVDNVNTFDTLLDVTTRNFMFADSTRLSKTELHAVGAINGDPLFGSVKGDLYFEMLPSLFPYVMYAKDSLVGLDSIVLSLSYAGNYGDSAGLQSIRFDVSKVTETINPDSLYAPLPSFYTLSKSFAATGNLGSKMYNKIKDINDSVTVRRDSTVFKVTNQVRIKLNNDVDLQKLFLDTVATYTNDTLFRTVFKGFKVGATIGGLATHKGALAYINLADTATRLEFYYRRKIGGTKIDTTSAVFFCGSNAGHANNIVRTTAGSEIATNASSDSLLYIATNPGSFARINIPNLTTVTNRIVHRAELRIVQIPDDLGTPDKLRVPPYLYLDRFDDAVDKVKFNPIPFDLNPSANYTCFPTDAGVDYTNFGGVLPQTIMVNGKASYLYRFNLTRYVQSIITRHEPSLDLRLSSLLYAEYFNCTGVTPVAVTGNRVGEGRIKLGGGASRNSPFPYKMQLRIIYSKL